MFTGIITALGTVRAVTPEHATRDRRLTIAAPEPFLAANGGTPPGASIACSGCCLTALDLEPEAFAVDVSRETLDHTTIATWQPGTRINLERSLRLGDELGGHLVSGHVDGLATLISREPIEGSLQLHLLTPTPLGRFLSPKGSIALDGVSLTVNTVTDTADGTAFTINLIPHTASSTTLGQRQPGDRLHVEIDMLARYVARLLESRNEVGV